MLMEAPISIFFCVLRKFAGRSCLKKTTKVIYHFNSFKNKKEDNRDSFPNVLPHAPQQGSGAGGYMRVNVYHYIIK